MKAITEYKSVDEVVLDLAAAGWIQYTKEGKLFLPARPHKPNQDRVERFMLGIIDKIVKSPAGRVKAGLMMKMLRGDNHPDEFAIATRRLEEAHKIKIEKQITGVMGRPCVYYRLFEF
jgi:hypothetical protein